MNLIPWLIWLFPFIGAVLVIPAAKISRKLRDMVAVSFPFLSVLTAVMLIPDLLAGEAVDEEFLWYMVPNFEPIGVGMLVDPLSIILANVVAVISFLIVVYSVKYMENDPGVARFWFFINAFIGSMLLLVLSDNLIAFYVGWKIVGLCSYGLIGYYYRDEREYWIGGPQPYSFQKPSESGLKALITTGVGDMTLLAGIIILYLYSGSFNYTVIYERASVWMAEMAKTPGMLALTSILILGGPIAKSAQFPLHEWLPEAMAGPAPVSALIHAATMVKAGVYLVARLLPIFFYGYWVAEHSEALVFFMVAAGIGVFTAFLAGTQGLVSLELKKALAYSTMSQIGYMMLGLGVAGLSPNALVLGYSSGLFLLISHAIFKAALFLGAGAVIHATGSIYMTEGTVSRRLMPRTWLFMWIAVLSLSGVPPLSGFWSKDGVLLSTFEANAYPLFALGLATVGITTFYSVRLMGLVFHRGGDGQGDEHKSGHKAEHEAGHGDGHHVGEPSPIMWVPYGILAGMTVVLGAVGPWFASFLENVFSHSFEETFHLTIEHAEVGPSPLLHYIIPLVSVGALLLGGYPAYRLYIKKSLDPTKIIGGSPSLQFLHRFLWNRWYMESFYNKVFVRGIMSTRLPVAKSIERSMDMAINEMIPKLFLSMRQPVQNFIEDPLDKALNEKIPSISVKFSDISQKFDEYVVDGLVNAIAAAGQVMSKFFRAIQRGVTEEYAFAFALGIILLALLMLYVMIFGV